MFAANQTITLDPLQAIILLIGQLYCVTLHALLLVFTCYLRNEYVRKDKRAFCWKLCNTSVNLHNLSSLWATIVKLSKQSWTSIKRIYDKLCYANFWHQITFTNETTSYKKMYLPVVDFRMQLDNIDFEHFFEAVVVVQSEMSNDILRTLIFWTLL